MANAVVNTASALMLLVAIYALGIFFVGAVEREVENSRLRVECGVGFVSSCGEVLK